MKKINQKLIRLVIILLITLVSGSIAVQEGCGDPTVEPCPIDDTGN